MLMEINYTNVGHLMLGVNYTIDSVFGSRENDKLEKKVLVLSKNLLVKEIFEFNRYPNSSLKSLQLFKISNIF